MCARVCVASQHVPAILSVPLKQRCRPWETSCQVTNRSRVQVNWWVEEVNAEKNESADVERTAPKYFNIKENNQCTNTFFFNEYDFGGSDCFTSLLLCDVGVMMGVGAVGESCSSLW